MLDNNGDSSASSSSSSLIVSIPLSGDGEREYGGENAISGGGGRTCNSMNSGEDLGFDLFLGLILTGGEILMDADLAGEPLEVVDDDDSSEFPPLSFMRWSD